MRTDNQFTHLGAWSLTPTSTEDDMTPDQAAQLQDNNHILLALAAGLDEAVVHDHDGKVSLKPFYARVAAEVAKNPTSNGADHTHAIDLVLSADLTGRAVGSTGPAQPLDTP
jgi:hypothetical protein